MGKTVLLVGSGGREHAMAWKLARSPGLSRLIIAPGNDAIFAGAPSSWERWDVSLDPRGFGSLAERAAAARVDLAVIGPDNPLADGIVDRFEERGIACFGPTAAAARIEASKAFAKDAMRAAGVPTAEYSIAASLEEARAILERARWDRGPGWVLKADGLALGKGVHVCGSLQEALGALETLKKLGAAASRLVIEERLQGEELSWLAFCDGERCALLEPARDYKRAFDGERGGNTGGMGAFSPVPGVPERWFARVREEVFLPTLRELKRRGAPFKGILYAGLMVDVPRDRIWVIEFNARFGDPEAQVLLARMSDDLLEWCLAVSRAGLGAMPERVGFSPETAVVVVAAAKGYPERAEKGAVIAMDGADLNAPDYFCAGMSRQGGAWVTAGGRVLGAMGRGQGLDVARARAYERLSRVRFPGMHYRKDIGGVS